jgi:hypothetical protein
VFADRPGDVDAIGRVIRTLTAMVAKRGLTGIYGLSRSHTADWQARADEAARRRQRLLSIPPNAPLPRALGRGDDAGERELEASNDGGGGSSGGGDDEGEERTSGPPPSDPPLEFEHLRAANVDGPVVIVGGTAKPEKLERLRRRTDLELEWVGVDPGSTQPILTLERRIRDGRLGAVVVLQDLMAHKHFEPLLTAARQVGVPWAYGGKAGKASLERALGEIDAMIAQRKS